MKVPLERGASGPLGGGGAAGPPVAGGAAADALSSPNAKHSLSPSGISIVCCSLSATAFRVKVEMALSQTNPWTNILQSACRIVRRWGFSHSLPLGQVRHRYSRRPPHQLFSSCHIRQFDLHDK